MYAFTCTDGAAGTVKVTRYRQDLINPSVCEGDADVIHTFSSADWTAIIALNVALTGATVFVQETLPFPNTTAER